MASYPTSVWNGDSGNRDVSLGQRKAPNADDWQRCVAEVAATQTRVDENAAGEDDDTVDSIGTLVVADGLTVVEKGDAALHKTIFTFDEFELATTDGTTPATDGAWGSELLYTFPNGHILILGAHALFPLGGLEAETGGGTGLSDTADFELGVGTVASANDTSFGLGDGTQENVIEALDVDLTSGASDAAETVVNATAAAYDGSSTAAKLYLNMRTADDADHGTVADVLKVSGTLTVTWVNLGDN
jgi:hypothetical protein